VEWVAHRAGNVVRTIGPAVAVADAIELDVHQFRRRPEVRHARVLWPWSRQWEPWYLLPSDASRPPLAEVLAAMPDDVHVWYDLKGFGGRLARDVLVANGGRRPITMSCRSWWVLRAVRHHEGVRTMKSVNNRLTRLLVARTSFAGTDAGVVIDERLVDALTMRPLRRRTPTVVAWGVTDVARAVELTDLGVRGLIVDDLDLITETRQALHRRSAPVGRPRVELSGRRPVGDPVQADSAWWAIARAMRAKIAQWNGSIAHQ
jgi:hypothetical protein